MKRAAIYARVSTIDRGQDPETQLRQLREYADRRGFAVMEAYVDHASGSKNDRERYRAMLEAARRRQFDVLLVWRYDRFARSMRELVNALAEFEGLGIDFISYNEGADTTTPRGRLLFGIMASLAEFQGSRMKGCDPMRETALKKPRLKASNFYGRCPTSQSGLSSEAGNT
jgi:DNA invertase Pin-like site-specific DNA recombinase